MNKSAIRAMQASNTFLLLNIDNPLLSCVTVSHMSGINEHDTSLIILQLAKGRNQKSNLFDFLSC